MKKIAVRAQPWQILFMTQYIQFQFPCFAITLRKIWTSSIINKHIYFQSDAYNQRAWNKYKNICNGNVGWSHCEKMELNPLK